MEIANRDQHIQEIKTQWEQNYVKCELNIKFYKIKITEFEGLVEAEKDEEKKAELQAKLTNLKNILIQEEKSMENTTDYLKIVN